jgi:hypothetical protein
MPNLQINSMEKLLKIVVLSLIFWSCNSDTEKKVVHSEDEAPINNISKRINDSLFHVNSFLYKGNLLKIELKLPISEIYYENKVNIIREEVILLISEQSSNIDSVFINFKVNESHHPDEFLVLYDKKLIDKVVDFNSKNKMYRDFNKFILKNINGDELAQFSVYLKVLKTVDPKIVKTDDFIQLLYDYIDEFKNKSNPTPNRDILIALKKLIIDGKEWKDFNPNDIDYFLNYQ